MDYRIIILIAAIAVALFILIFKLNYKNLSWKENKNSYLGLLGMLTVIAGVLFSMGDNKKQKL